jgi:hypothetical protein
MKKTFYKILVSGLIVSLLGHPAGVFAQSSEKNNEIIETNTVDSPDFKDLEKGKQTIYERNLKILNEKIKQKNALWGKSDVKDLANVQKVELKALEIKFIKDQKDEEASYMKANGWEKIDNKESIEGASTDSGEIQTLAISPDDPSSLIVSDSIYYNSSYATYNFSGSWNFTNGAYHTFANTYDVAGFRQNTPWVINSSYGYTYSQNGTKTGEDYNGSLTPGSRISKQYENKYGVAFNVRDELYNGSAYIYYTDNGSVSTYVQKGSGTNKMFLDFDHNWKSYSFDTTASITGYNISSTTLTISYSGSPKRFKRTSSGRAM